jgi:hypothetical protein
MSIFDSSETEFVLRTVLKTKLINSPEDHIFRIFFLLVRWAGSLGLNDILASDKRLKSFVHSILIFVEKEVEQASLADAERFGLGKHIFLSSFLEENSGVECTCEPRPYMHTYLENRGIIGNKVLFL